MPLIKRVPSLSLYVGIGLLFVFLVVTGAFYTPKVLDSIFHWWMFAGVSVLVFGFQIRDYWHYKQEPRFWLPIAFMFICHFEFWVHYVHPRFGSPRLLAAFSIFVIEYLIVSMLMRLILPVKPKKYGS